MKKRNVVILLGLAVWIGYLFNRLKNNVINIGEKYWMSFWDIDYNRFKKENIKTVSIQELRDIKEKLNEVLFKLENYKVFVIWNKKEKLISELKETYENISNELSYRNSKNIKSKIKRQSKKVS